VGRGLHLDRLGDDAAELSASTDIPARSQAEAARRHRGWTARTALARSLEVAREEGPRGLWFGVLAELCYRRLAVFELALDAPPPQLQAHVPITVVPLADIDDCSALQPELSHDEIARRLAAGHSCWLARTGDTVVATCWVASGELWSEYLGRRVPLAPGEACTYETLTTPSARGLNIGPALRGWVARDLHDRGYRRLLATVLAENAPAIRLVEKLGYRRVGTIGYAALGGWRRDFVRVRAGALAPGVGPVGEDR
jgi:GNAT superfamily N-acetyltransferase